ncbi:DUF192 domain-containing protein [Magnetovibrio blakemorei]|uniref:DUF192 domain-containing protein n=1 Tax=Magnetovibrio blakemorei TaxID=28181 RepID=A0A1E5QAP4_9PROT|nr:DUF192 domain-containing protein [Magnetovibrio blakemorei]OEJ69044.1 hypothetical protein BEN30_04860 [Magnetovibrio blakemorei]
MFGFAQRSFFLFAAVFAVTFAAMGFALPGVSLAFEDETYGESGEKQLMFPTIALNIVSQNGKTSAFEVELAMTPAQQRRGLMFRDSLAPDRGMLFDYTPPRHITMWMKNTLVSLDMLFFDADAKLVYIAPRTKPLSLDLIRCPVPVRYVLEVPAGTAQRLALRPGDRLELP